MTLLESQFTMLRMYKIGQSSKTIESVSTGCHVRVNFGLSFMGYTYLSGIAFVRDRGLKLMHFSWGSVFGFLSTKFIVSHWYKNNRHPLSPSLSKRHIKCNKRLRVSTFLPRWHIINVAEKWCSGMDLETLNYSNFQTDSKHEQQLFLYIPTYLPTPTHC